jgi:hypothetical protein
MLEASASPPGSAAGKPIHQVIRKHHSSTGERVPGVRTGAENASTADDHSSTSIRRDLLASFLGWLGEDSIGVPAISVPASVAGWLTAARRGGPADAQPAEHGPVPGCGAHRPSLTPSLQPRDMDRAAATGMSAS